MGRGPRDEVVDGRLRRRIPAGEPVEVKNLCPGPRSCVAARGIPKGATCPPMTTPVLVKPPGYACVWDGKTCSKH